MGEGDEGGRDGGRYAGVEERWGGEGGLRGEGVCATGTLRFHLKV